MTGTDGPMEAVVRLTLVIPPSTYLIDDRVFPFLGPLQIAAVAREKLGLDVTVLDLTGHARTCKRPRHLDECQKESIKDAAKKVLDASRTADVMGFYALVAQYPVVRQCHRILKAAGYDGVTMLGGPHANTVTSGKPDYQEALAAMLAEGWDFLVHADQGGGGGEDGFVYAMLNLDALKADGQRVIKVPSRPPGLAHPNDRWPYPARDLIDLGSYKYTIAGEAATSFIQQSGCSYACSFCSHWGDYRRMVSRSIDHVIGELRQVKRRYGIRAFMDYSDEVNLRHDFTDYLDALTGEDVVWRGFFKSGRKYMTDDLFARMRRSGCVNLCTGVESLDPDVLRRVGKGSTVDDNMAFVRLCRKHGILPKVFLQIGLPGETEQTAMNTKARLLELASEGPLDFDMTVTVPYYGTPIWESPEKFSDFHYDKASLRFDRDRPVMYKSQPGAYQVFSHTDGLTAFRIVELRDAIEREVRAKLGLAPLMPEEAEMASRPASAA